MKEVGDLRDHPPPLTLFHRNIEILKPVQECC
jgi:hypothetical protein